SNSSVVATVNDQRVVARSSTSNTGPCCGAVANACCSCAGTLYRSCTWASRKALLAAGVSTAPLSCSAPRYGSWPILAISCASDPTSCGRCGDGIETTAIGRCDQSQSASTLTIPLTTASVTGWSGPS